MKDKPRVMRCAFDDIPPLGTKHYWLTYTGEYKVIKHRKHFIWLCDCGNSYSINKGNMKIRMPKSCGCRLYELMSAIRKRHGQSKKPTWLTWRAMVQRCTDPGCSSYPVYGGNGIKVCRRWRVFENFLADMGHRPDGMQIDRYPNKAGDYRPGNCRWATCKENQNNRKDTIMIKYKGKKTPLQYVAADVGIRADTLIRRIKSGWPLSMALSIPVGELRHAK